MSSNIETHFSVQETALREQAIASLEANRIDPKFLYVTPRQSALWREVFLRHSPVHNNPEFWRIYHEAFAKIAATQTAREVHLVGLGCGTGVKERELSLKLKNSGISADFSAIDVSRALVEESMQTLASTGAAVRGGLICDLTEAKAVGEWLQRRGDDLPRLLTLFGLVPNLLPSDVVQLAREVLRPGDVLLVNAHLAPVDDGVDLTAAMRRVLPQYDQLETSRWLMTGIENWGLENRVEAPRMTIGEIEGIPAFVALAHWKSAERFKNWDREFEPDPSRPLQAFRSLRYTPSLFENLMRSGNLKAERLAMTACREEAIWSVTP